jgi:hypothetical protein
VYRTAHVLLRFCHLINRSFGCKAKEGHHIRIFNNALWISKIIFNNALWRYQKLIICDVQLIHANIILLLRMLHQYEWLSVVKVHVADFLVAKVHVGQLSSARKTRPRYVVENRGKCKKIHAVPSVRNKSLKPECFLSFNMGWRILVFYPSESDG